MVDLIQRWQEGKAALDDERSVAGLEGWADGGRKSACHGHEKEVRGELDAWDGSMDESIGRGVCRSINRGKQQQPRTSAKKATVAAHHARMRAPTNFSPTHTNSVSF